MTIYSCRAPVLEGLIKRKANVKAATALVSGELPKGARKLELEEGRRLLKEAYPNPELQKPTGAFEFLARTISRSSNGDDQ
ncbi:hypothetical protein NBRC116587_22380 [Pseudoteredinibacter isoporae]